MQGSREFYIELPFSPGSPSCPVEPGAPADPWGPGSPGGPTRPSSPWGPGWPGCPGKPMPLSPCGHRSAQPMVHLCLIYWSIHLFGNRYILQDSTIGYKPGFTLFVVVLCCICTTTKDPLHCTYDSFPYPINNLNNLFNGLLPLGLAFLEDQKALPVL